MTRRNKHDKETTVLEGQLSLLDKLRHLRNEVRIASASFTPSSQQPSAKKRSGVKKGA